MKKFTKFYAEQADIVKKHGLAAAGALNILGLNADYDGVFNTTARELTGLFGLNDWRAVCKLLDILSAAKWITVEKTARGTKITLTQLDDTERCEIPNAPSVVQTPTLALGAAQRSVVQAPTLPLSSPLSYSHPINPADEYLIYKQQENYKKEAKKRKQPALFAEQEDPLAGTFRAKGKSPQQQFANWFVQRYSPTLYNTGTARQTGAWYKANGSKISTLMGLSAIDGSLNTTPLEFLKAVTLETEKQFAGSKTITTWGLQALINNFSDNSEVVLRKLRSAEVRQANAAEREDI